MVRRAQRLVLLSMLASLLLDVPSTAAAAASSLVPATHLRGSVCLVEGSTQGPFGKSPPSVSAHPSAVEIVWIPGLNDKRCQSVLTRGGAHVAAALASTVNHAPVIPKGALYACPADDGTSVRIYFSFGDDRPAQRIDADLTGCSWISAPGEGRRSSTSRFRNALDQRAPSAWRRYFAS
jgi:hypothetical protein